MRLLILGGGSGQLSLIKKAKELGHQVVVSDYYPDAPGKKIADFSSDSSTFDLEANLKTAEKYEVDGILTAGTDQPVYTAAQVAEKLNLNQYLSVGTAEAVTNKRVMKSKFSTAGIPTVKYKILAPDFLEQDLKDFKRPLVVKPLDSQGQRGVFKLNSIAQIREKFNKVLSFSRQDQILVEEYYKSNEITISGWVFDNRAKILTVTDRLRFEEDIHIGICSSHLFPSQYLKKYKCQIEKLAQKIVNEFGIVNGPIYFQFLIGEEGIKVNEIACRIGGAYEGDFMPELTGVDILKMMVELAAGQEIGKTALTDYSLQGNSNHLSSQLFFAGPGKIRRITEINKILKFPGVLKAGLNYELGNIIPEIENATARAGYFIVLAENKNQLQKRVEAVYDNLKIIDQDGNNLVLREIGENFGEGPEIQL
ncbi:phosphoribosylaminoimidazole carboxylase (NCAIR synthetase) [Halanaerobium saccharolyticum]|uniref:Phosphoribosylaminoimidazole carboxylase (NCAIR synthetase) n=1 Tax=Halanaerobium saccharolyticum TaxID=43595 RepID=A0A4R7Z9Z7_9FIRM|nr:ATP-grasp domain-containing protein [Halanaerobium saccharolyticum]RAK04198.1 phosphoribosylaminoimidazole carboxylase (NCAIR synthetase) [Halanaerobium saccharolyticum]TDW06779.1 phosphoribosylaminoimidazole carboxylase (NCAIR synthetase) [Halanaerobium saccharolyticum]TDX62414.1 phosphoribosylaminoimidazole carboxylase (NCAIR synthetase) [Halanaerobium saccharolyticum]